jgi:SET domain-containing protein
MTAAERVLLDQTTLHDYIFEWEDGCAMALGWVPLFNHASPSNCEYVMDYEARTMRVETVRDIRAGEELTINYNGDYDDKKPVWFEVR